MVFNVRHWKAQFFLFYLLATVQLVVSAWDCTYDIRYNHFTVGSALYRNEYLCTSAKVVFGMDNTGDLVLFDLTTGEDNPRTLWRAGINTAAATATAEPFATLEENGNFVVYSGNSVGGGEILWETDTRGAKYVFFDAPLSGDVSGSFVAVSNLPSMNSGFVLNYWRSDRIGGVYGGGYCKYWPRSLEYFKKGGSLTNREYLCSSTSENLIFGVDETGDLALIDVSVTTEPIKIWSAGTSGTNVTVTLDEDTGNMVAVSYDEISSTTVVLWDSQTNGATDVNIIQGDPLNTSYVEITDMSETATTSPLVYWRSDRPNGGGVYGGGFCKFGIKMPISSFLLPNEYLCGYDMFVTTVPDIIFGMDATGDLVLFDVSGPKSQKIWCAGTSGESNSFVLWPNGTMNVIDGSTGNAVWEMETIETTQFIKIEYDSEDISNSYFATYDTYYYFFTWVDRMVWNSQNLLGCGETPTLTANPTTPLVSESKTELPTPLEPTISPTTSRPTVSESKTISPATSTTSSKYKTISPTTSSKSKTDPPKTLRHSTPSTSTGAESTSSLPTTLRLTTTTQLPTTIQPTTPSDENNTPDCNHMETACYRIFGLVDSYWMMKKVSGSNCRQRCVFPFMKSMYENRSWTCGKCQDDMKH